MLKICIFTLVRTSCENFITGISLTKWNYNSFDLFYKRKSVDEILKAKPNVDHICKVYIETYNNEDIKDLIRNLNDYKFVHFFRSNTMKHYLTRKIQDNLIGEYGKDYKKFEIDIKDYNTFVRNNKTFTSYFLSDFKEKLFNYDVELGLTNNIQEFDNIIGNKIKFNDAFDLMNCKKFITNFKDIEKYL